MTAADCLAEQSLKVMWSLRNKLVQQSDELLEDWDSFCLYEVGRAISTGACTEVREVISRLGQRLCQKLRRVRVRPARVEVDVARFSDSTEPSTDTDSDMVQRLDLAVEGAVLSPLEKAVVAYKLGRAGRPAGSRQSVSQAYRRALQKLREALEHPAGEEC